MENNMARIRNVKPEFFIDPDLQDLEAANPGKYTMMVYEGLWTQSSKNGVFLWEPRILKLYILPFLPFDIAETLDILYKAGFLKRFQVDGKKYGYIPTFSTHQTISGQETKQDSKYPDYVDGSDWEVTSDCPTLIEGSAEEVRGKADLGRRTLDEGHLVAPQAATVEPFQVVIPETPKPESKAIVPVDPNYSMIKDAFEKVNGDFTNYGKEGKAIKTIIKLTHGDTPAIQTMIKTFFNLRKTGSNYWRSMPFTPSRLASSGVWDGVKVEAMKSINAKDVSWVDALEKQEATA